MDVQTATHRWLSPSLFALVALCLLLPFANVEYLTAFNGTRLVTHTVPAGGVLDGSTAALVALAMSIVGVLLGLLGIPRGPGWAAAVGAGAMYFAVGKPLTIEFGAPGPFIDYDPGYYIPLLLFVFLGGLHVLRAFRRAEPRSAPQGPLSAHVSALLFYGLAALVCLILGSEPPGLAQGGSQQTIGSAALAWLGLAVVPAWLAVAVALGRWQKAGRPDLTERAARWDALLWLGPLLALALVRETRLGAFLLPPSSSPPVVETSTDGERVGSWSVVKLP